MTTAAAMLVTVGSDHHPFDRLIGWVDDWLSIQDEADVVCVTQHGTAAAPLHGTAHPYLPHPELQRLLTEADIVVTQGGPMGIVESRRCGTKPIAVPRVSRLGEVVDDHQVAFCRQLALSKDLAIAEDSAALWAALDLALLNRDEYSIAPYAVDARVAVAVERFAALVDSLPTRRRFLQRIGVRLH